MGNAVGRITTGVARGTLPLKTIQFIYDHLPKWRDEADRPYEESEHRLNPQLCKFLESRSRSDFPMIRFDHEEPQSGHRQADLAASPAESAVVEARSYSKYDPLLIIECKRLPAPSKDREREYVTGAPKRSGGIQRFKLGLYASEHEMAVLVGYVQGGTLRHWHGEINRWISELVGIEQEDGSIWSRNDSLEALHTDKEMRVANCRSSHGRIGKCITGSIEMHHLWVVMPKASD